LLTASMIHQDPANHLRAYGKEVDAVLAADAPRAKQLKIRLIDQCSGFERTGRARRPRYCRSLQRDTVKIALYGLAREGIDAPRAWRNISRIDHTDRVSRDFLFAAKATERDIRKRLVRRCR